MDEHGTGGGDESAGGKFSTSYEASAGRQRFRVKLRPGETTIVSWKKLLKDATARQSKANGVSDPAPSSSAAAAAHQPLNPSPDSCIAPVCQLLSFRVYDSLIIRNFYAYSASF